MRIALLSHAFPPEDVYGIPLYVAGLAQALAARGHDLTVVAGTVAAARAETRDGYRIEWLPQVGGSRRMPAWGAVRTSRRFATRLRQLHREQPFEIVESPNYRVPGFWPALNGLGGARRPKFILRVSSPRALMAGAGRGLRLFERLERWNAHASDGIIGNTALNLDNCRAVYRLPAKKPTAVILHALPPGPPPECLPEPASPDGTLPVLYVGRMEERKGFDVLAAAWPAVLAAVPAARLIAVGEDYPHGAEPSFAQWALRNLNPAARSAIDLRGFVSDAAREELYRRCLLLVAPSRYESFGLMLLEAMRYGRTVVSCHVGGIPEVVRDGETGLLVPPDDPPALAQALIALLTDAPRRQSLAAAGVRDLQQRFTRDRLARETEEFYAAMLARD